MDKTKEGKINLCKECGDKPTISSNSPLCASCMAKRRNKSRKLREKALIKKKEKIITKGPLKEEKPIYGQYKVIKVDFERHSEILRQLKELSEVEIRPVEFQIIYILKSFMNGIKPSKETS